MPTLKEASLNHSSKKEIFDLAEVPVNIEVQESEFKASDGLMKKFKYIEIDGYKYTIRNKALAAMKGIISARPTTTKVKFNKTESGDIFVVPLD